MRQNRSHHDEADQIADRDGASSLADQRGTFRDRRFVLLFCARTSSVLGSAFGPVALAFGVLALPGATATTLSLVTAAEALSMVAFVLIGGVIADRFPRFRVMVTSDILAAFGWGAIAAMLVTGWAPTLVLVLAAAFAGMATALFFPAFTGAVPEVVPAERLQAANGFLRVGMNFARIGGFAVAGGAVAMLGAGWAMALNSALLLGSASFVAMLRMPTRAANDAAPTTMAPDAAAANTATAATAKADGDDAGQGEPPSSMLRDLKEGWLEFRSRQWLWVVVLQYSVILMLLQAVWGVLGPVVANERLGGPSGWSWVLAGESIGMLVGVVFAIRMRPKRPIRLVVLLTFPLASLPLVLGLGAPVGVAVVAALVGGIATDILVVLWETTMQREIPKESLSRVSSYDALGSLMLMPVGLVLAGPSIDWIGVNAALLLSAAVTVVASIAALCSPGVRNLQWSTPEAEPAAEPRRHTERDLVQLDTQPSQPAPRPTSVETTLIDA